MCQGTRGTEPPHVTQDRFQSDIRATPRSILLRPPNVSVPATFSKQRKTNVLTKTTHTPVCTAPPSSASATYAKPVGRTSGGGPTFRLSQEAKQHFPPPVQRDTVVPPFVPSFVHNALRDQQRYRLKHHRFFFCSSYNSTFCRASAQDEQPLLYDGVAEQQRYRRLKGLNDLGEYLKKEMLKRALTKKHILHASCKYTGMGEYKLTSDILGCSLGGPPI